MKVLVLFLALALVVLHHDFWFWNDRTLLFGFLPIGLAYHALFSVAAAALWAFAAARAWPETVADEPEEGVS